jgi:hypothetical protein
MTTGDWVKRARQFLNTDAEHLRRSSSDSERRVAIMDIHATLDDVFRWHLYKEHGESGALDNRDTPFSKVVDLLRQHSKGLVDQEMANELVHFNRLRNSVVHEQHIPTRDEVTRFAQCASTALKRLLDQHARTSDWFRRSGHPGPKPGPVPPEALKHKSRFPIVASATLTVFSLLYWMLPDLLPFNPVDDIIIGCPLLLIAGVLLLVVLLQKEKNDQDPVNREKSTQGTQDKR